MNKDHDIYATRPRLLNIATIGYTAYCLVGTVIFCERYTFSSEGSEDFKSRTKSRTPWHPGQDPEKKDCPEKSRTDGHLRLRQQDLRSNSNSI